jgi:hypothetical protein
MTALASLALKIDSSQVDPAAAKLDKLTAAAGRVENQVEQTTKATQDLGQEQRRAASGADSLVKAVAAEQASMERAAAAANQLVVAHSRAATVGRVTSNEMLNLSRQFSDVAVTAAMGMNPLMILIQQGPQIADVFFTASARGLGFSAVMKDVAVSTWAAVAPLAPFLAAAAAIAAVLGGGLLAATHEINKEHKDFANSLGLTAEQLERVKNKGVTMGDVLSGTFAHIGQTLKSELDGPLKWLSDTWDAAMSGIANGMTWAMTHVWASGSAMITGLGQIFKTFPKIVGDAAISAVNLALSAIEGLINRGIAAINKLSAGVNDALGRAGIKLQIPALDPANITKLTNPFAGAMGAVGKAAGAAFDKGLQDSSKWLNDNNKSILDAETKRILGEAGKAKTGGAGSSTGTSAANDNSPTSDFDQKVAGLNAQIEQAKAAELQAQLGVSRDITARAKIERDILDAQLAVKAARLSLIHI